MKHLTDGERDILNEQNRDAAPPAGCIYSDDAFDLFRGDALRLNNGQHVILLDADMDYIWTSSSSGLAPVATTPYLTVGGSDGSEFTIEPADVAEVLGESGEEGDE